MTRLNLSPREIDTTEMDRILVQVRAASANRDPWSDKTERWNIEKAKRLNAEQDIKGEIERIKAMKAETRRRRSNG